MGERRRRVRRPTRGRGRRPPGRRPDGSAAGRVGRGPRRRAGPPAGPPGCPSPLRWGSRGARSVPTDTVMSIPVSSSPISTSWIQASSAIRVPWSMPRIEVIVAASRVSVPGRLARDDSTCSHEASCGSPATTSSTTPERVRAEGLTTTWPGPRPSSGPAFSRARSARPSADPARLGEALQHRVDDRVDRARADRVVGGVADHVEPGQLEEPARPCVRLAEQGAVGLGPALEATARRRAAARFTSTRLEVTPMSMLARDPERSSPRQVGSPSTGAAVEVAGERGDARTGSRPGARWPRRPRGRGTAGAAGGPSRSCRGSRRAGTGRPLSRRRRSAGRGPRRRRAAWRRWSSRLVRYSARTREPSGASHQNAGAVDRRRDPPPHHGVGEPGRARSSWGIWAMWPNMSGR